MITYRRGDALCPPERPALVAHVVNDCAAFGEGFAGVVASRYPVAKTSYMMWVYSVAGGLGRVKLVDVLPDLTVAHLCAQHGLPSRDNPQPLQLDKLADCLTTLHRVLPTRVPLHMPRIGTGYGGRPWWAIEAVIQQVLPQRRVYVYDYVPLRETP